MMGHINNLVVRMVNDKLGEEAVSELFTAAGLERREYQPEVIYPEEEFQALFLGAQQVFGVDGESAERAFSEYFMQEVPKMFPAIFELSKSARQLIERVPIIHRNFPAAASQGDYKEKVFISESTPERLVLEYESPNLLCLTLRCVTEITLEFYGEKGSVYETECQKEGAARCRIVVEFHGETVGV